MCKEGITGVKINHAATPSPQNAAFYGRCEALDPWKNIFSRLYMAAAGDCSLLIAETADMYDRNSGVIVKKGII